MEIKGYTLHGDYYLADKVIPNKTWKEACEIRKIITLLNGKTVIAHTLSKEELESIPEKEREVYGFWYWYWTNTPFGDSDAWSVNYDGDFGVDNVSYSSAFGGIRLGFKNPF